MSQLRSNSSSPFNDHSDIACFQAADKKKFNFNSMSDFSGAEYDNGNSYTKINRLNLSSTMKKKKKRKDTKKLSKMHLINDSEYDTCFCCLLHRKYFEKIEPSPIDLSSIEKFPFKKKLNSKKVNLVIKSLFNSIYTDFIKFNKAEPGKSKVHSTSLPLEEPNLSKHMEAEYIEKINKLCSNIVDLNIQNKQTLNEVANNITRTDLLIDSQITFFKQISQAIKSFVSINSYLIFEFNNSQNLETDCCLSSLDRFNNFEEFLKVSSPLTVNLKFFLFSICFYYL